MNSNQLDNLDIINNWHSDYHNLVANLDPLNANAVMKYIPTLNQNGDIGGLVQLLHKILPKYEDILSWSFFDAAAAMRDIGFFLGSIRRHGSQPTELVDNLTPVLLILGAMTYMPPRDTFLHIVAWNPLGDNFRTYTCSEVERLFLEGVKVAVKPCEKAVWSLMQLHKCSVTSEEFTLLATESLNLISKLVEIIINTRKIVSPETFIKVIRPYYQSIIIEGKEYKGSGAVELPLFLFDHILWNSQTKEPQIVSFKECYVPTLLPYLRQYYKECDGQTSILDNIELEVARYDARHPLIEKNLKLLNEIFKALIGFREPHFGVAHKVYLKSDNSYSHGSGGYQPSMLRMILDETRTARKRLVKILENFASK